MMWCVCIREGAGSVYQDLHHRVCGVGFQVCVQVWVCMQVQAVGGVVKMVESIKKNYMDTTLQLQLYKPVLYNGK